MNGLAGLLRKQGAFAEARDWYVRAIAIRRRIRGDNHPYLATMRSNLGMLLMDDGDLITAEALVRDALLVSQRALPADHPQSRHQLSNLAACLVRLERFSEAEALLAEAEVNVTNATGLSFRDREAILRRQVELWSEWHATQPNKGYDAEAAKWRVTLAEWQATTQPAIPEAASRPSPVDAAQPAPAAAP